MIRLTSVSRIFAMIVPMLATVAIGEFGELWTQTPIKIGIVSPTFGHAPFYVARDVCAWLDRNSADKL